MTLLSNKKAVLYFAAFVGVIVLANLALRVVGTVPVFFWLPFVPAGVYFAGAAFTLRDLLHEEVGRWWVFAAIAVGGILSFFIAPGFALASAVAFTVSEVCDLGVYEPLRKRNWKAAVFFSGLVGSIVDSVIFLQLANLPAGFWNVVAMVVGKLWITALFAAFFRRPKLLEEKAEEEAYA